MTMAKAKAAEKTPVTGGFPTPETYPPTYEKTERERSGGAHTQLSEEEWHKRQEALAKLT